MRIISGAYRGKKLYSPESNQVRPTADRTREALFNILNSMLENSWSKYKLLDVFAGTGAVSLEAISRGVAEATLIDKDTKSLQKNLALFVPEKSRLKVLHLDIKNLPVAPQRYNLLFMDAPYNQGLTTVALEQVAAKYWLEEQALCIVEVEKNEQPAIPACYQYQNERIYGLAKIIFLKYMPSITAEEE